jgi:glycine/D-amino acid oxidase-like deaminating enzyme
MSLPQDTDVLIVGAGMAGVTTAWALRQVGIRSIVLDAQDCIGGRIHTSRKWKKIPCDMGAGWVSHPTINPLIEIARKEKIKLKSSDPSKISIHGYSKDEIDVLWGLYAAAYAGVKCEADRRRNQRRRAIGLSHVFPGVLNKMDLDPKMRPGIEFFIDTSITQAYAADQKDLSLYNCLGTKGSHLCFACWRGKLRYLPSRIG